LPVEGFAQLEQGKECHAMFKLMLVEDEPIIREGLKHYFDWKALNFTEIIEAENGQEGVTLALAEKPDLVITDISMPVLNGLEMIHQLREQLPNTLFVILTGYSDFHYAKRAIQIGGITEYLLKPLQYENSIVTIEKCSSMLLEQRKQTQEQQTIKQQLLLHEQFKASDFIRSIITEEADWMNSSYIEEINTSETCYSPFIISYIPSTTRFCVKNKHWRPIAEQVIHQVHQTFIQHNSDLKLLTYYSKNKMYGLAVYATGTTVNVEELCSYLNNQLHKMCVESGIYLFVSQSEMTTDLANLQRLYKLLDLNLNQRYFVKEHYFLTISDASITGTSPIQLEDAERGLIKQCLQQNTDSLQQLKHLLKSKLEKAAPSSLLAYMQELMSITIRFAHKNNIQIEGVYNERLFNLSFLDEFISLDHLINRIGDWIIQLNRDYLQLYSEADHMQDDQLFKKIEQYVLEHIDQDITLQMVANRFFYNPSYLSRLFKQKLEKNYSLFQAEIRISYAQKCLQDSTYSVADVAIMCGYRSYKHFVKTFKLVTQMTPTTYRKQLGLQ